MNDTVRRICDTWYDMEIIQATGDTIIWNEIQHGGGVYCLCYFNLSVTLDSLEAGSYFVKTYASDAPFPGGDTCYIGSVSFTITEQNSFASFNISDNYQSDCFYVPVGINMPEQSESRFFTIYPNPATSMITIVTSILDGNPLFTIFSVNGEKVIEKLLGYIETQIDISTLQPGFYFVQLQNEKMIEVKKMIKE
jgi:hypothetical protein